MGGNDPSPPSEFPPILSSPHKGARDPLRLPETDALRVDGSHSGHPRLDLRLGRLWRTARHLTAAQIAARARFMVLRQLYSLAPQWPIRRARRAAAGTIAAPALPKLPAALLCADDAPTLAERAAALAGGQFHFIGRTANYAGGVRWRDADASPLWLFNLHYLGGVLDLTLADRDAAARALLRGWSAAFDERWDPVAWHPYPVSLRLTNLCFAAAHRGSFAVLGNGACQLAATHAAFLLRHLEYDLRGNHLLENACALLVASRCLSGGLARRCEAQARDILAREVPEQVQADGSHFELSPMYHLIVMQRLLQALALLDSGDALARDTLAPAVARMARFLAGILCPDGDIPLLGDAARGFAAAPAALLALAEGAAGTPQPAPADGVTSFADAGLHVLRDARNWVIFDAGPVCPDYLPGHGQADSLTVEVWCDGVCVVGDPGVHEYTGPERAWNRSSRAHSTLTVDDADSSEVYGSFRVGGRARISDVAADACGVAATLHPFGTTARLRRRVALEPDGGISIADETDAPPASLVRSRLHLHPQVEIGDGLAADRRSVVLRTPAGRVRVTSSRALRLETGRASRRYGRIEPTTILVQDLAEPGADDGPRRAAFAIVAMERQ